MLKPICHSQKTPLYSMRLPMLKTVPFLGGVLCKNSFVLSRAIYPSLNVWEAVKNPKCKSRKNSSLCGILAVNRNRNKQPLTRNFKKRVLFICVGIVKKP